MADSQYLTVSGLSRHDLKRIFSRIVIDPDTHCWEWYGMATACGYGRVRYKGKTELTHRFMYAWLVEPLPRGRSRGSPVLDHETCNFPPCCNPSHMKLVSNRENSLRSRMNPIIDNAGKRFCLRGHPLPDAPNDRRGRKRYCKTCANEASSIRRNNPQYRAEMLEYFRRYNKARMNGPRRNELLARAAAATRSYRLAAARRNYKEKMALERL